MPDKKRRNETLFKIQIIMAKQNTIEIDGQKYRRLYYNICCRCALRPEVTGKPCPIEDCEDGIYYKEIKEA